MKHLLKMSDLTREELYHILDTADRLKAAHKAGEPENYLSGKSVALMFSKNSTNTRASFEVGVYQMGGYAGSISAATDLKSRHGEPLRDTARALGRFYDAVVWRTYQQKDLEELAAWAGVPVINGLTDYAHPCQVLADLMTIREYKGRLEGLRLCFMGDGNNIANSLIVGGLLAGMQVTCACPTAFRPNAAVLHWAEQYGDHFTLTDDYATAAAGADVIVTTGWTSVVGQDERERAQRVRQFKNFRVDSRYTMAVAAPDCMVLHGLPARRGEEITDEVLEAHAAEIFDEMENRMHVQKAVLAVLLAGQ